MFISNLVAFSGELVLRVSFLAFNETKNNSFLSISCASGQELARGYLSGSSQHIYQVGPVATATSAWELDVPMVSACCCGCGSILPP